MALGTKLQHVQEFIGQSELIETLKVFELAAGFHGVGNAVKNVCQLLNGGVFRPVIRTLEMLAAIGVIECFLAGVGDLALGVIKFTVEVVCLLRQRKDAVAKLGT